MRSHVSIQLVHNATESSPKRADKGELGMLLCITEKKRIKWQYEY